MSDRIRTIVKINVKIIVNYIISNKYLNQCANCTEDTADIRDCEYD